MGGIMRQFSSVSSSFLVREKPPRVRNEKAVGGLRRKNFLWENELTI